MIEFLIRLFATPAKADDIANAITTSVASSTESVSSIISSNLPTIMVVAVGIFMIFLVWRLVKRLIGGR